MATLTKSTLCKAAFTLVCVSIGVACAGPDGAISDGASSGSASSDGASVGAGGGASVGAGGGASVGAGGGAIGNPGDVASPPNGTPDDSHQLAPLANLAPGAVNLGMAGDYAILTKSGVSTVPPSVITGNLGVSPIAAAAVTGFSLSATATNVFSTSAQVSGKIYAANYAVPSPSNLTIAILDMQTAFSDAASRAPKATELSAGNIGGMTLTPGVYKWASGLVIPTDVTLSGSSSDVWIFQVAQNLTMASAKKIILTGGALPRNIFWQVSGRVDIGTTSHFEGIVLSQTAIALATGASINGRLLAQTAVTLDSSTVVQPAP